MSTTTVYFVPVIVFPVGDFKAKVEEGLTQLGLIDGYYDEAQGYYAAGNEIAFEYASINDGDVKRLVPEASSEGYGATCPHCGNSLDEAFYEVLNDYYELEYETGKGEDMTSLPLTCKSCNNSFQARDIKFTQPVLWVSQYFQFVDIDDTVPSALTQKIKAHLGSDFQLVYEQM